MSEHRTEVPGTPKGASEVTPGPAKKRGRAGRDPDAVTLAKLWPRPNFRESVLDGTTKATVAIMYMMVYENLRRRPVEVKGVVPVSDGYWERMYRSGVGFLRRAWETRQFHTMDRLARAFSLSQRSLAANDVEMRYATSATSKGRLTPDTSPLELPPYLRMRQTSLIGLGWPGDLEVPDDAKVGVIHVDSDNELWGFAEGYYPALALTGSGRVVPLKQEPYASRSAATRSAITELKESIGRNKTRGGTPVLDYKREGPDWRNGVHISEAVLISAFRFKGLEFGRWVTAGERQSFLDGLYDACMDLCSVLGTITMAASCYSRLGIAFGSQGRGSSTGAAHFDREVWLMHLTKSRGGGALCHEYGHALDGMIVEALFDPAKLPEGTLYMSDLMATFYDPAGTHTMSSALVPMLRPGRHPQSVEIFDRLFESLFSRKLKDSFYNRSEQMDVRSGVHYWASPRELFARAFETFALDRMEGQGTFNSFLVRHVDGYMRDHESHRNSIFPQGYQRQELSQQFDVVNEYLNLLDLRP